MKFWTDKDFEIPSKKSVMKWVVVIAITLIWYNIVVFAAMGITLALLGGFNQVATAGNIPCLDIPFISCRIFIALMLIVSGWFAFGLVLWFGLGVLGKRITEPLENWAKLDSKPVDS